MGSGPWVRGDDDVHPGCVPRASASDAAQGPRDGQAGAAAHTLGGIPANDFRVMGQSQLVPKMRRPVMTDPRAWRVCLSP